MLVLEENSEPQGVFASKLLAGVGLNSGREARQPRRIGKAVEDHVAMVRIGREARLGIANERCDLRVEALAGELVGEDPAVGDFLLVLVELGRIEIGNTVDVERRLLAVYVWNQERADEAAAEQR